MIDENELVSYLNIWAAHESCMRNLRDAADVISECIEVVNRQPKTGGWIPCSERLPEFGAGRFLVCLQNGCVTTAAFPGEFMEIPAFGMRKFYKNNPVVAWQPLPEPPDEEIQGMDAEGER